MVCCSFSSATSTINKYYLCKYFHLGEVALAKLTGVGGFFLISSFLKRICKNN